MRPNHSNNSPTPPRWLDKFLERFCAPDLLEEVMGDLHERYYIRIEKLGGKKANRKYYREVLSYLRPSIFKRKNSPFNQPRFTDMLRSYSVIAMRNLAKHKFFTFINISGLAIGLAAFILIGMHVFTELSYDRYHDNAKNIYRVVENLKTENELLFQSTSSPPMGPAFAREFPEVLGFVRMRNESSLIAYGDKSFYEEQCYLADSNIFEVFDFPLLEGNPKTALVEPKTVVITKKLARKYFGAESPLNQSLSVDGENFRVTGVADNVRSNSHFTFDLLASFSTFSSENKRAEEEAWFWNGFHTYLLLKDGPENVNKIKAGMDDFIAKYIGTKEQGLKMYYLDLPLQPLTSIYLEKPRSWENGKRGSKSNLYILAAIAFFILIIASFNYINLATARASRRMKEVGLRKVLGAERRGLIQQFLGESIIVSYISMVFALIITFLLMPLFNNMLDASLSFDLINTWYSWLSLFGLSLIIGLLSGAYPAFIISGFHPLQLFKHSPQSVQGNIWIRKILVAGQFIISITLIAGTLLVFDQLEYVSNIKLGFNKDQVMKLDYNHDERIREHLPYVKSELTSINGIEAVSASYSVPGEATVANLFTNIEIEDGKMSDTNINTYAIDFDFIPNFEIEVIAGRAFSRDYPADDTTAFIINETAVRNLGWSSPDMAIGNKVDQQGRKGTIVGVVKDFNYKSLHHQVEPLLIHMSEGWYRNLSLKLSTDNIPEVVAEVEKKWKVFAPHIPFVYSFLDQDYDSLYKSEQQLSKVASVLSGLAIFVACLGLLGLTSFSVERRYKEIGIRKVLGASIRSLVIMISKEFVKLIGIALVIAIPITYYMMDLWLVNFSNHIDVGPWVFVIAGLSTLAVAWLTISFLSIKAAMSNPVDSLQNE